MNYPLAPTGHFRSGLRLIAGEMDFVTICFICSLAKYRISFPWAHNLGSLMSNILTSLKNCLNLDQTIYTITDICAGFIVVSIRE